MLLRYASPWFHVHSPLEDTISGARPRSTRQRLDVAYTHFLPVLARARIRRVCPRAGPTTLKRHFEPIFLRPNKLPRLAGRVSATSIGTHDVRALGEKRGKPIESMWVGQRACVPLLMSSCADRRTNRRVRHAARQDSTRRVHAYSRL
jgi:hypothetical protein